MTENNTYWAHEHSYEENVLVFGKPLADLIEYEKGKPELVRPFKIVAIEGKTVTISTKVDEE